MPKATSVPPPPEHARAPLDLPARFEAAGDVRGRKALVSGGGRGLGLAMACALAEGGAAVAIAGRHREFLDLASHELERRGPRPVLVEADVSDPESARAAVREAAGRLGGLDVLVNNAGSGARGRPEELSEDDYDRIFDTNVKGLYYASCEATAVMAAGGSIVNVASVAGMVPDVELAAYCASKAAVIQLTRVLAVAWGGRGVRVNAVAPGYTDSPLNAHRKADPARAAAVVNGTPLGRWGTPADVAQAVVFLASRASAFVTGQVLTVDGGYSVQR
ncbi:MAG: glucose 1-dehydrogenase [Chloroflexota bacterium]|nr:glucose 1-dehydrogenase [Chloroflexota bacterium]